MRVAMEDLLYSYGVDIVFNGHVSDDDHPSYIPFYGFKDFIFSHAYKSGWKGFLLS